MNSNRINKKFLSDVDSRDLIKAIRDRPGLYNNSMLETPRKDHKQTLWQEVGERLTDTDVWEGYTDAEREARLDEIREKWRHLRNNFLREIKLMRSGEKKRKYIFFDDMEFMTPFVGIKIRGPNKIKREKDDDSGQDSAEERKLRKPTKMKRPLRYEDSSRDSDDETDFIQEQFDALDDSIDEQEEDEVGEHINMRRVSPRRSLKTQAAKQLSATKTSTPKQRLTKEQEMIIKRFDVIKKIPRKVSSVPLKRTAPSTTVASPAAPPTRHVVAATGNPNRLSLRFFDMRDSDISFCMSMVSTFRKMGEAKKLRAKIDMLKVLHKYADDLDETPKTRVRNDQQQRIKTFVANNDQSAEDADQSMEDHSKENGSDVKCEAKLNDGATSNVWWT